MSAVVIGRNVTLAVLHHTAHTDVKVIHPCENYADVYFHLNYCIARFIVLCPVTVSLAENGRSLSSQCIASMMHCELEVYNFQRVCISQFIKMM